MKCLGRGVLWAVAVCVGLVVEIGSVWANNYYVANEAAASAQCSSLVAGFPPDGGYCVLGSAGTPGVTDSAFYVAWYDPPGPAVPVISSGVYWTPPIPGPCAELEGQNVQVERFFGWKSSPGAEGVVSGGVEAASVVSVGNCRAIANGSDRCVTYDSNTSKVYCTITYTYDGVQEVAADPVTGSPSTACTGGAVYGVVNGKGGCFGAGSTTGSVAGTAPPAGPGSPGSGVPETPTEAAIGAAAAAKAAAAAAAVTASANAAAASVAAAAASAAAQAASAAAAATAAATGLAADIAAANAAAAAAAAASSDAARSAAAAAAADRVRQIALQEATNAKLDALVSKPAGGVAEPLDISSLNKEATQTQIKAGIDAANADRALTGLPTGAQAVAVGVAGSAALDAVVPAVFGLAGYTGGSGFSAWAGLPIVGGSDGCVSPSAFSDYRIFGQSVSMDICSVWGPLKPWLAWFLWAGTAVFCYRRVTRVLGGA